VSSGRIEAFSDGVIAILITIMVLELKVPHGTDVAAVAPLWPVFLSYVLSFVYVGIYWSNHHHMFQAVQRVNGAVLWGNLHFLFWLSLIPFTTGWMGENHFAPLPTAVYGANLLLAGVAYVILQRTIVVCHGPDSTLAQAIGRDFKGKASLAAYVFAIPLAFVHEGIACAIYALVALIWFVPDPRIERRIA
jgi:TMEM175 potassium channel family protein